MVAAANERLFQGYLHDALRTTLFNDSLKVRHGLAREHATVVDASVIAPLRSRRLDEEEKDWRDAPRAVVRMRQLSAVVCDKLNESDYALSLDARMHATRQWSILGGEGSSRINNDRMWCWDCEFQRPLGCEAFFTIAGRRLQLLRAALRRR
mgnify:FL=1